VSCPRLIATYAAARPEAVVVMLHGGAARPGRAAVRPAQLSVLRMVPLARRIARAGRGRVVVLRLLNSYRGWDATHTPVDDVTWAIAQVREQYGDLPIGLVGHSLGGRAALMAGGLDGVRVVVALKPWVYATDRSDLTGRQALVVHGTDDRVADPERARTVAETIGADFVSVEGGRHAMLRHGSTYERLAADFVLGSLVGVQGSSEGRSVSGRRRRR
jgi:pimeloyl-ACP methyl ester carboxylesterase